MGFTCFEWGLPVLNGFTHSNKAKPIQNRPHKGSPMALVCHSQLKSIRKSLKIDRFQGTFAPKKKVKYEQKSLSLATLRVCVGKAFREQGERTGHFPPKTPLKMGRNPYLGDGSLSDDNPDRIKTSMEVRSGRPPPIKRGGLDPPKGGPFCLGTRQNRPRHLTIVSAVVVLPVCLQMPVCLLFLPSNTCFEWVLPFFHGQNPPKTGV
jgi:hypothetical protein